MKYATICIGLLIGQVACSTRVEKTADTTTIQSNADPWPQPMMGQRMHPAMVLSDSIDLALASQGQSLFETKCAACHKLYERYVGPPLGDVLDRRRPTYVMNMILYPDTMQKINPFAKALLAEYLVPMPNQNLTESEARAVLEYLRSIQSTAK